MLILVWVKHVQFNIMDQNSLMQDLCSNSHCSYLNCHLYIQFWNLMCIRLNMLRCICEILQRLWYVTCENILHTRAENSNYFGQLNLAQNVIPQAPKYLENFFHFNFLSRKEYNFREVHILHNCFLTVLQSPKNVQTFLLTFCDSEQKLTDCCICILLCIFFQWTKSVIAS